MLAVYCINAHQCHVAIADVFFFFFNDTATTEIYTLSLHDALPISRRRQTGGAEVGQSLHQADGLGGRDRKSTRLNSSHVRISYAVFCLKKKRITCILCVVGKRCRAPIVQYSRMPAYSYLLAIFLTA